jgi:hypothetical protein
MTTRRLERLEPWINRFAGHGTAMPPAELGRRTLIGLLGLLVVWRGCILLYSYVWGRLPIYAPWPPEIDPMWLFKFSIRWDAGWYLTIATEGYSYDPNASSSVAFFPLFPLLIRAANVVLPGGAAFAGLVVVHLALAAAVVYVYKLVRLDFSEQVAWRTVVFLLVFPGAFFFSAIYAESLLLLGFAGSLYHARRGQWLLAGLFGVVASATKFMGIILIIPLAVELIAQRQLSWRKPWPALSVALAPLGAAAYFIYLQLTFGNWRATLDTQSFWHRETGRPAWTLFIERMLGDESPLIAYPANTAPLKTAFLLMDTSLLWLFTLAGIWLWWRYRPSYGAFVLAGCCVFGFSGIAQSINRYTAVLFPAFLILGTIKSEVVRTLLIIVSVFGLTVTAWLYVEGYWAG